MKQWQLFQIMICLSIFPMRFVLLLIKCNLRSLEMMQSSFLLEISMFQGAAITSNQLHYISYAYYINGKIHYKMCIYSQLTWSLFLVDGEQLYFGQTNVRGEQGCITCLQYLYDETLSRIMFEEVDEYDKNDSFKNMQDLKGITCNLMKNYNITIIVHIMIISI